MTLNDLQNQKEKALNEISKATLYAKRNCAPATNFENWWASRWETFANCEDVASAMRKYLHHANARYTG